MDKTIIINNSLLKYLNDHNLEIKEEFTGHITQVGKSANKERNKYYLVNIKNNIEELNENNKDNIDNNFKDNEYFIMECEKNNNDNIYFSFSKESLTKVQDCFNTIYPTWFQSGNGYIITHIKINNKATCIHLHQHLMDYYGQKDSSIKMLCSNETNTNKSIDHINRDPLDNRLQNLRIINQSHQNINQNTKPRTAHTYNIDYQNLKKYIPKNVNYVKQTTDKKGLVHGEHFTIEIKYTDSNTIKQKIRKKTTKSQSIDLPYKLIQALKIKYQLIYNTPTLQTYLDLSTKNKLEYYKEALLDTIKEISETYNIANNSKLYDLTDTNISFKKKLEKIKCTYCENEFTGKSSLSRHIKRKHNYN